jgi:hypothetical protein
MRVSKPSKEHMEGATPCDRISIPTHNTEVLAAYATKDGGVVELIRYTYSQGLHNYLHLIYQAKEVM